MFTISNLKASVEDTEILKGVDLSIKPGEVHALMGVNGSGKSTLANVIAGREEFEVIEGSVTYNEKDILDLSPEERAGEGVFMAFQYPVELPGVLTSYFLRTALNSLRSYREEAEVGVREFSKLVRTKAKEFGVDESFLKRAVNDGFSGGEKKRLETFQMALLNPSLCILDETDSGLDIDSLRIVADGVNRLREQDTEKSFLVITHYQRLLDYIVPDVVHIMIDGKIVRSGDKELALKVEKNGYQWVRESIAA